MTANDQNLPVLGAALPIGDLERLHNWVLADQRDLELQDYERAEVLDGDWSALADRHRQLLDGYEGRFGIHGPYSGFSIASRDPEIRKVVTRRLLQGLEVVESLGASHMVVHSPFTTWDHNNFPIRTGGRDKVFERSHQTLKEVVARAEAIGCTLVIENIEDKEPMDRVELARSFASSSVKVSLDTGHAHYAHVSTGAPPVDVYVRAAGDLLDHIHLQDADGYADRHWAPGEGTILWPSLFEALRETGAKPRLILELIDNRAVLPAAEYFEDRGLAR